MPSREEKWRRRQIVRDIQQREWTEAEARMPISKRNLHDLLGLLEETLFERREDGKILSYCDHTLARTRSFLQSRGLPEDKIVEWLHDYGGFCDCEVAYNVGDAWEDRL